jgi:Flp pilus assembly protein TadD
MAGRNAARRALVAGWPLYAAMMILPLMGCTTTQYPGLPSFSSDSHARAGAADAGAALRLARATRQAGDLTTAIPLYRNLATAPSVAPEVLVEFGDALVEGGFPDDAIDVYSRVGPRSPAHLGALLGIARADLKLGDPSAALGYLATALDIAPRDPRVLVDKGVALDTLNRHAEAQACYRTVLSEAPRYVSARNNLALSLALTGQFEEALALITPLVRSSAANARTRENMALIYGLMGDADRAASLSRMDLDEGTTQANLAFLAAVRGFNH